MSNAAISGLPVARRHSRAALAALLAMVSLVTACIPASPVAPQGAQGAQGSRPERVQQLPAGAFYLRTIDGAALPVPVGGGMRIESGFVVADTTTVGLVGFGESVAKDRSASFHLASGSALVIGQAGPSALLAHVTWQSTGAAQADSVRWGADSVIVYRTGTAPSVAGAGHRFIYTRAVPSDTL